MKFIRKTTLRNKITLMIIILLTVTVLVIGGVVFNQSKTMVVKSIGYQALEIAERAADLIDPNEYKLLLENGNEESPYYTQLRYEINDLREKNGILYIYTMQKLDSDTYIYVVDGQPLEEEDISGFGDEESIENISQEMINAFNGEKAFGDLSNTEDWGELLSAYAPIIGQNGKVLGIVGADYQAEEIYSFINESRIFMIWIFAIILVIGLIVSYIVTRSISRPLEKLVKVSKKISEGDLSIAIESLDREDEIGHLYNTFEEMVKNLRTLISAILAQYTDLEERVQIVDSAADSAESSMLSISASVEDVAKGSEVQLSSLTSSVEDVTAMADHIEQIEKSSNEARRLSSEGEEQAEIGREVLNLVKNQIIQIDHQASDSSEVIISLGEKIIEVTGFLKIIAGIARQTNLLALNAAIESARAGEEGRGFAVVAKEISTLADESATAADNVTQIINTIQNKSDVAIKSIDRMVQEVQSGVSTIANADQQFEKILYTNQSVNQNIAVVAEAIKSISGVVQQIKGGINGVSALSEEANATSEEVASMVDNEQINIQKIKDQSVSLVNAAKQLQKEIEKFRI